MTPLHGIACFYDVGFGARAVSRKTPIYFIFSFLIIFFSKEQYLSTTEIKYLVSCTAVSLPWHIWHMTHDALVTYDIQVRFEQGTLALHKNLISESFKYFGRAQLFPLTCHWSLKLLKLVKSSMKPNKQEFFMEWKIFSLSPVFSNKNKYIYIYFFHVVNFVLIKEKASGGHFSMPLGNP